VAADDLNLARDHLILTSDTVCSRETLLRGGGAVARESGETLERWLKEPEAFASAAQEQAIGEGPNFSLRVSSKRAGKEARKALLLSLRKPIDGLVSRYLNRHISLATTRFLVTTGLAPNVFTVAFMALGLLAAYFATQAHSPLMLVLAGLTVQGQSILDGCDGEMARLTYRFSKTGQWLDSIGDDLTNYAFCFGLAVGQARVLQDSNLYWLGASVLAVQIIASGLLYRRMIILGTGDLLAIPDAVGQFEATTAVGKTLGFLRQLFKRDSFVFILAVTTAAQLPLLAFSLFTFGTVVAFFGVLLNERRLNQQASEEQLVSA
jgi:phosphatidylglycerophosphate synthase